MGTNSIILVHADKKESIQKDKSFGKSIGHAIDHFGGSQNVNIGTQTESNVACVISNVHESYDYFIRVFDNTAKMVGWSNATDDDLEKMAEFLKSKGYSVTK
jgi:hypothetical protein